MTIQRHTRIIILIVSAILVGRIILLPKLFDTTHSTVILANDGQLLGAKISDDQQWRFPSTDSVCEKFTKALITFEDKRFYQHFGVDPIALMRACWQFVYHRRVVSGASTLSMQVIRLNRNQQERNIIDKLIEMESAFWLELFHSKREILALYASNAPFGGNVIGIEAASWRYFGRSQHELSWAEAAMLAVLPNQPSLIHLKRNRELLLKKRNSLLKRLHKEGYIDNEEYSLAIDEPLPDEPLPLPQEAPHLLNRIIKSDKGESVTTTIDANLQRAVSTILKLHNEKHRANKIENAACLVAEISNGNILAYVGNVFTPENPVECMSVDIIPAPRSSGSILKPLLYASMLSNGEILPNTLISDTPLHSGGFAPKNYNRTFEGAVSASDVIIKSLNVPSVRMLQSHGIEKFRQLLISCGLSHISHSADHYGLSLILGGAEVSLWDITQTYTSIAQKLQHLPSRRLTLNGDSSAGPDINICNAALWIMTNTLNKVNRPEEELGWQWFESHKNIAWKTGTSYGNRDGWCIGFTSKHIVAVWVGNASGEGRPTLTGIGHAAPIMFEIFNLLPNAEKFDPPEIELREVEVCANSGHLATTRCAQTRTEIIPTIGIESTPCPYCQKITLDQEGHYRVDSRCYQVSQMQHVSRFVLPPIEEWYYKQKHLDYKSLEPLHPAISHNTKQASVAIIYPVAGNEVVATRSLDGKQQGIIFQAVHTTPKQTLFWHVDNNFIGSTTDSHKISWRNVTPGHHKLTVVDMFGNSSSVKFSVPEK